MGNIEKILKRFDNFFKVVKSRPQSFNQQNGQKRFDNFFKVVKSRPPIVQPTEWAKI